MKPVCFRLYPTPSVRGPRSSCYVRVKVWPTRQAFAKYAKPWKAQRAMAFCADPDGRTPNLLAEVNLFHGALTLPLITHELAHATFHWARRAGLPFEKLADGEALQEEQFCYALDSLLRQFLKRTRERGLLP